MQIDRIKYTMKHRKAFRAVEKQLLGHNTIRGYLHDLDKVFLYMVFRDSYYTRYSIYVEE